MEKYTRSDTKIIETADAPPRIDAIRVRFPEDSDGCTHDPEMCDGDGGTVGCVAEAEVSYSLGGTTRRLAWFTSVGLWGICEDTNAQHRLEYRQEVAGEELDGLKDHLARFGVSLDAYDRLAAEALAGVKA